MSKSDDLAAAAEKGLWDLAKSILPQLKEARADERRRVFDEWEEWDASLSALDCARSSYGMLEACREALRHICGLEDEDE
jgi:hypothetical protein